jgi:hypothetical protein
MNNQLRTNLFHFDPHQLAPVHQWHSTSEYRLGWQQLARMTGKYDPPTTTLEEMLGVLSGGPVWVNPYADRSPEVPVITLLNPLPHEVVCRAIELWSLSVIHHTNNTGSEAYRLLVPGEPSLLHASTLISDHQQITPAYKVIPWMVTQVMAATPMESSYPLDLTLCSDSTLLAWDRPLTYQYRNRSAWAMHAINAQLVLLHRCPMPYIAINVHLSHLLPQWRHSTRSTWLKTPMGISKLSIHITPKKDGHYSTVYSTEATHLLELMGQQAFPELGGDDIAMSSDLRPIHAHVPPAWPVGSGTGPLFLDQACFHLLKTLPGASPMLARRVTSQLRTVAIKKEVPSQSLIRIAVVTAHTDIMSRLLDAHKRLGEQSKVFRELPVPALELKQIGCPNAQETLCSVTTASNVEHWFNQELLPKLSAFKPHVAIIETSLDAASNPEADPKHILRALCAKHGIPTQFLIHTDLKEDEPTFDEEETDYRAVNGLIDALRGSGFLPSPLSRTRGVDEGTTVVSIYLDEIRTPVQEKFLPIITRTRVGEASIQVFWPNAQNENIPQWFDYREGLCRVHATAKLLTKDEAQQRISQALLAPTAIAGSPLLIYLHSEVKKLYPGLNDGLGNGLPGVPNEAWVIRIRADNKTAQMSGDHTKSPFAAQYIGNKLGVYEAADHDRLHYFVSHTKQYGRVASQRKHTRYDIPQGRLRDPWQQLGVTEMVVIQEGNFSSTRELAMQTGIWCRDAPLWDGYLRLPSPLHAAKQIAQDHPVIERRRKTV